MSGRLLSHGEKPHRCDVPGWRERRKAKIRDNAIWQCDECGRQYRWAYDGWDCTSSWTPHYPKPLTLPDGRQMTDEWPPSARVV